MICLACGADGTGEAVYPYPEDDITTDFPIEKLFVIDAAPHVRGEPYRACIFCHECWHRLHSTRGIDMWISQACWESLNPVTPYAALPIIEYRRPDGSVGDYQSGSYAADVGHYFTPLARYHTPGGPAEPPSER